MLAYIVLVWSTQVGISCDLIKKSLEPYWTLRGHLRRFQWVADES